MAAASTHIDFETRADALLQIFRELEGDSNDLATQFDRFRFLSSTDTRVKPWIDLLRAALLASRRWVADMQQQTTREDVDGQERYFDTIKDVVNSASRCFDAFASETDPRVETLGLLFHLFEYVKILYRNLAAWVEKERHNPSFEPLYGINPPQLDSTDNAEMPPARRGSAQRQQWVNEDVNPGSGPVSTGNPYIITRHKPACAI